MNKIYFLESCSTCQRIIKELKIGDEFEFQNIKVQNINARELGFLKDQAGSYEDLFSRRAMKYRAWGLHEKELTEKDYRELILKEYTFLKRPVIIVNDQVFVGNTKKVVEQAKAALSKSTK